LGTNHKGAVVSGYPRLFSLTCAALVHELGTAILGPANLEQ